MPDYQHIEVTPLTPAIGATIEGIDLSHDLPMNVIDEIRQAYLTHLVVFFRDQHLTPRALVRLAKRFGDIGFYPFVKGMDGQPEVVEVVKKERFTA